MNIIQKKNLSFEYYDGYNNKASVDKIDIDNQLISENWKELLSSMEKYLDFKNFDIKSNSFIIEIKPEHFEGNHKENIYLIVKQSPINTFKKRRNIFKINNFVVKENKEKLIKFPNSADIIIYKNIMYTINYNFEDIFGIENSIKKYCEKHINHLISSEIIYLKNENDIKKFFSKNKGYKRFITYSNEKIQVLLQDDKIDYIKKNLNIDFNIEENKYILDSEEKIDNFTKIICGKIHKDFFNDNLLEVASSKQITIKN